MIINQLYKKYFQKSKLFLYPLLGFERGTIAPIQSYMSLDGKYNIEDRKFILVYAPNLAENFEAFKTNRLLKHKLLIDNFEDDDKNQVFVFDFSSFANEWDLISAGKYSQISIESKRKILKQQEANSGNYIYMHSYLFPKKWFSRYAELLDVKEDLLISVGELIDKPNFENEAFQLKVKQQVIPIMKKPTVKHVQSTCPRCNGTGRLPQYNHIQNGVCFKCGGTQVITKLLAA